MEIASGDKKEREDEDDRDSCNRRLQDNSFGATALLMRLVMLNTNNMTTFALGGRQDGRSRRHASP